MRNDFAAAKLPVYGYFSHQEFGILYRFTKRLNVKFIVKLYNKVFLRFTELDRMDFV